MADLERDRDLFTEQVEIERTMTREGIERAEHKTTSHVERGTESETSYGAMVVKTFTDPVATALQAFIDDANNGKPGRRHASAVVLKELDARVIAYLGLKTVANTFSTPLTLTKLAFAIGRMIADELIYQALREEDSKMYARLEQQARQRVSHRNKTVFVKTVISRENIEVPEFKQDTILRCGEKVLEIIIEQTGLVQIERIAKPSLRGRAKSSNIVSPTPETLEWIEKRQMTAALLAPKYLPMVVPPAPWDAPRGGGYLTSFVRPLDLVKVHNRAYQEELADVDMPLVYSAVNTIQETAWCVNERLLHVIEDLFNNDCEWAGIPTVSGTPIPPKPHDIAENEEARTAWRRAAGIIHSANRKQTSKRLVMRQTIETANRFAGYDAIYFPYQLDFRGRVYAVPQFNPQGPDAMRALIQLADPMPLGDEGYKWMLVQGSGLVGVDKVDFPARCAFIERNEDDILEIAADPYGCRKWIDGFAVGDVECPEGTAIDKPYQFLSWCFEYADLVRHLDDGGELQDFPSRIVCALDGSCSGLQHYSMALRDPVGAAAVNLSPSDRPQDVYRQVADEVEVDVTRDLGSSDEASVGLAKGWIAAGINRKLTKRPVMTFPYGSGQFGYTHQILDDTLRPQREANPDEPYFDEGQDHKAASYMAAKIANALPRVVKAATEGMDYLKKLSGLASSQNLPVRWTTPLGFLVNQANYKTKDRLVNTMIAGKRVRITVREPLTEIDNRAQANGISPNFIHSLDAAHLQLTVVRGAEQGLRSFALIHDSFGTHVGNTETLFHAVREAMVEMYSEHDVFETFRQQMRSQLNTDSRLLLDEVAAPEKGDFDPEELLGSLYAFA